MLASGSLGRAVNCRTVSTFVGVFKSEINFRWYFASRVISLLGTTMAPLALSFAVLDELGTAESLGLVLAAHSVPMVGFLLFGGVIADRFDRKRLIQYGNVIAFGSQGFLAHAVLFGDPSLWTFVCISFVNGSAASVQMPAQAGLLVQVVEVQNRKNANASLALARNMLMIGGPGLAGLLTIKTSAGVVLAIDAMTWLVAAVLFAGIRVEFARSESGTPLDGLREGAKYLMSTPWLWRVIVAATFWNAIQFGAFWALGPAVLADSARGASFWGFVVAAQAAGAVVASVALAKSESTPSLLGSVCACALVACPIAALAFADQFEVLLLAAFIGGVGLEVFALGWALTVQNDVPERLMSRVYSYDMFGSYAAIPVGQATVPFLASAYGSDSVLLAAAALYVCVAIALAASLGLARHKNSDAQGSL